MVVVLIPSSVSEPTDGTESVARSIFAQKNKFPHKEQTSTRWQEELAGLDWYQLSCDLRQAEPCKDKR